MKLRTLTTAAVLAIIITPIVNASPDILPGLWETKIDMSSKSGQVEQAMEQAQKMLESLPPEQQKMMKDMMAKQGVNFDFANRTLQTCITQANIDKFDISQTTEGCQQSFEEKSKNHYTMTMKCPAQNMSGQGEFIINNNKSYHSTVVMDVNMNGQQDTMTMKQEGTWLSADCGEITPE